MKRFGNQSKKIACWLRELSDLDLNIRSSTQGAGDGTIAERINVLRGLIPTSMLRHYDHFKSRGKRSVAPVTRGVCGSCHLAFPSGVLANLRRMGETLNVCINCGAFVYVAEEELTNGCIGTAARSPKKIQSKRGNARPSRSRTGKLRHTR
jgi:predicted  nucleic acid-binding Zn-ribbon protein